MTRKKFWLIILGLTGLLTGLSFIPVTQREVAGIRVPLIELAEAISKPSTFARFYYAGTRDLTLTAMGAGKILLTTRTSNDQTSREFRVLPGVNPEITLLQTRERRTLGSLALIRLNLQTNQADALLKRLKQTMEDTATRYGYLIHVVPVGNDSVILTATDTVGIAEVDSCVAARVEQFRQLVTRYPSLCASERGSGVYQVSNIGLASGRRSVSVGIPVRSRMKAEEVMPAGMRVLELPGRGRLLTGSGPLKEKTGLAYAMNKYLSDQTMKRVAQPFEIYRLLPSDNDSLVKLVYPVY